ncbi:MAG TPA: DNA-3-methyladenine glycosylase [Candidatus Acidoferrales bacterium]|nr:DNA-3-methyladenine glycosylase [Candidatus Acidoferrales bacterium]
MAGAQTAGAWKRHLRRLRVEELPVDTTELARYLIGKTLVHDVPEARLSGRIVEAEAYPIGDAACHAFRGETARNRTLFGRHGHAYVYFNYGVHWMMNVSSEPEGKGGGVLIRGIEPLEGIEIMERNRGVTHVEGLTKGPGRLARAMQITKAEDGLDLCSPQSPLWLGTAVKPVGEIGITTRIGLSKEAHRQLRFFERGNPFVSGPRRLLL